MNENVAYKKEFCEELVNGRIVAMSPAATNHNRISGNIFLIFGNYLRGKPCVPFGDGEKVFLTGMDHYVPDFMVVCDRDKIKPDGVHGAPDLVVEILSPSTQRHDRLVKLDLYQRAGVREYWIVDPDSRTVQVFLLDCGSVLPHEVYGQDAVAKVNVLDGCFIELAKVFKE